MRRLEKAQNDRRDFSLNRWSATFRRPERERAYLRQFLPQTQTQLRVALIVCAVFYVAFGLSDVAVLGFSDKTLLLFMARLLVAVATALVAAGTAVKYGVPGRSLQGAGTPATTSCGQMPPLALRDSNASPSEQ
mgnify:CR=1 FL=1